MSRLLVIEDDEALREGIAYALKKGKFEVLTAGTLREALPLTEEKPDLALLDINLPDGDGREFLKRLRRSTQIPVLLLTARDGEKDMLAGFEAGCDDYITKPFSMSVLIKRIEAILKRSGAGTSYAGGDLYYVFEEKRLEKNGTPVRLTATEIKLLELFLRNRNQVLTREQLLERIWDEQENYVDEKTLTVNIRRLREKIEDDPGEPAYIRTVFGIGYKWSDDNGR